MAFPEDETDIHFDATFGANLADDPAALAWGDELTPDYVKPYLVISRGFTGDVSQAPPGSVAFGLRNPDGIFSPRNVNGPHYGNLRQNTPVRARVGTAFGESVRGFGYVPSWPVRETGPDIEERIETTAAGALQRLTQHGDVQSAMQRTILASGPKAYWPLQDESGATVAASGLPSGIPMTIVGGSVDFGSGEPMAGAARTPDTSTGSLSGSISGVSSSSWHVEISFFGFSSTIASCMRVLTAGVTGNTWRFFQPEAAGTPFSVIVDDPAVSVFYGLTGPGVTAAWGDSWHTVAITASQSGGNVTSRLYIDGTLVDTNVTAYTLAAPTAILLNQNLSSSNLAGFAHILAGDGVTPVSADAVDGYIGETAGARFARLCDEAGEHYAIYAPDVADTQPMGVQGPGTLADLLVECAYTDEGLFADDVYGRLLLVSITQMYANAAADPVLDLDYEDVTNIEPDNDDRDTLNIATVTRVDGGGATVEVEDGPLGSNRETGVGPYRDDSITRSLDADTAAVNHAGWLTHTGTTDKDRIRLVLDMYANPTFVEQWIQCDIGSRVRVTNAPAKMFGPDPLSLMLVGYVEVIDAAAWTVEIWLVPYAPYEVGVLAETSGDTDPLLGWLDWDTCTLDTGVDDNDTTFLVNADPLDTTDSDDFPRDVFIGGERVTVTACAGGSQPQTWTVTRSVNGVAKSHDADAVITLAQPIILTL